MLSEGDAAPDVTLQMGDGSGLPLAQMARPLVVYFYPKDDTSGCTAEAKAFSDLAAAFEMAGTAVLGISKNTPKEHAKFIDKYGLKVPLATDADGAVCEAFGTWTEKSMYGRKYMGIERATFLIDSEGQVARVWRKVSVPGHADEVLAAAAALTGTPPA